MDSIRMCCKCSLPIHSGETGLRHYGLGIAHAEYRCIQLLQQRVRELEADALTRPAPVAPAWYHVGSSLLHASGNVGRADGGQVPTLDLYTLLCDLCDEANAVDTLIGRPEALRAKLKSLRDEIGSMTASHVSVAPAAAAQPAARAGISSADVERMIVECVPGGSICDPQQVADSIRRYCDAQPAATAGQPTTVRRPGFVMSIPPETLARIEADRQQFEAECATPPNAAAQPDLAAVAQEMREALGAADAALSRALPMAEEEWSYTMNERWETQGVAAVKAMRNALAVARAALARYDALPAPERTEPVERADDPHAEHWQTLVQAGEAIARSALCGHEQAREFCCAMDRLSTALMANDREMSEREPVRPLAWIRKRSDGTYEDPIADCDSRMDGARRTCGAWTPLYEQHEISPEFTDTARAALLWVLWHHQGGSSPVGQPIRFALGMGAHDPMSEHQVAEAKRWGAMTRSATADFHQRRGAYADIVDEALASYEAWMAEDDYNATDALHKIMNRMRQRRNDVREA